MIELVIKSLVSKKEKVAMADKPLPDLETFVKNVNKKDGRSGRKVYFAFVKRKRK